MKIFAPHLTDFYKVGHIKQYPAGTQMVYSNFTPRSARLASQFQPDTDNAKVLNFGLSGIIQWLPIDTWNETFFHLPKELAIARYKRRMDASLGEGAVDVAHFEALHDLGYLPVNIMALPEGGLVPMKVPMFTIQNTLSDFYWLPNYLETQLSAELWKTITTATTAYQFRKLFVEYAKKTGAPVEGVEFQGHDFSMRGQAGVFDAVQCGAAHLTCFMGTDTIAAIDYLEDYYQSGSEPFIGGSVPATEHSVMCMGGKETELDTYARIIDTYPTGIVSIVSDTWDYWNVLTNILPQLQDKILARQPNALGLAKVVIRPDSGNPLKIICGEQAPDYSDCTDLDEAVDYFSGDLVEREVQKAGHGQCGAATVSGQMKFAGKFYEVDVAIDWNRYDKQFYYVDEYKVKAYEEVQPSPAQKGSLEILWDIFGGTINEQGYRVLNPRIGLIYGDSITFPMAKEILATMERMGFCSSNIVFGIGSFTYQYVTRDTYGFAMKATAGMINGEKVTICKDPITDTGSKKSAKGFLNVHKNTETGEYYLEEEAKMSGGEMKTVFYNGEMSYLENLGVVRSRVRAHV